MATRKELKEQYKAVKPIPGVFQIENIVTGLTLIEGSTDMNSKWNRHKAELRFGSHRNIGLQKDWDHYKEESFIFKILTELEVDEINNQNLSAEVKILESMILEEGKVRPRYWGVFRHMLRNKIFIDVRILMYKSD